MKLSFRKLLSREEMSATINKFFKEYVGLNYRDEKYNSFHISDIALFKKGKTYHWSVVASPISDTGLIYTLEKHTVLIEELINGTYKLETNK